MSGTAPGVVKKKPGPKPKNNQLQPLPNDVAAAQAAQKLLHDTYGAGATPAPEPDDSIADPKAYVAMKDVRVSTPFSGPQLIRKGTVITSSHIIQMLKAAKADIRPVR